MLFSFILVCIIQIFYNCFTFCDSVLVSLLCLNETNSMTHWCCMTCHVVLFILITIALLRVTCLTSTTILQKLRADLMPQECAICSPRQEHVSPPWQLAHHQFNACCCILGTGLSPSLRGNICVLLQTPWMSYWQQHCRGCAELAHFPGCLSDVLALLFLPHLPRVEAVPAVLNPCIWWWMFRAVYAITTSLTDLLWLVFCCSLARAFSDNLAGSCLALTITRIKLIQIPVYSWGLTVQCSSCSSQNHCCPTREVTYS